MLEQLITLLDGLPRGLATFLLSMVPITELQGSIPTAVFVWQLPPLEALGWAVIGNCVPIIPLYLCLEKLRQLLARFAPALVRPIDAILVRAEGKLRDDYARYGAFALFLFSALPLPLTGAWTATAAAVALKIPFRYGFPAIAGGILVAGIFVVFVSGALKFVF